MGLTETPPAPLNMHPSKSNPLTELFNAGIPIALWPRQAAEEDNIHQILYSLLHGGTPESLPIRLRHARSLAGDGDVVRTLTLLWDDYDRIPPQYRALEEEAFDDLNL